MTDQLTTTENNALKWVMFRDYYRRLSDSHSLAAERYYDLDKFLRVIGVFDD